MKLDYPEPTDAIEFNERLFVPKLIIRPNSSDEEFDYLKFVLEKLPFYREKGYLVELPNYPEFQRLATKSPDFDDADWKQMEKTFLDKEYDESFFAAGLHRLEAERTKIESVFPTLLEFHNKWGFRLFPNYSVTLTRYGPGGKEDEDSQRIIMMTRGDGSFKRSHPADTVVHGMVQFGIQVPMRDQFRLTHEERERVVDRICMVRFKELLPGYEEQVMGDRKIDPFITSQSLEDLPGAISEYTKKFPRE